MTIAANVAMFGPERRSSPPAALARLGRRLSRVSLLLWELRRARAARADGPAPLAEKVRTLSWLAENLCALHGLALDVVGRVPDPPVVLVANHLGYFDPMVILALHAAMPIAKRELAEWPLLGRCLCDLGVEFVERGHPHRGAIAMRHALSALAASTSVLAFPEGTTSTGATVMPLRRGMIGAARIAGVPIVPVALAYDSDGPCWVGDDWFLPHYAGMLAQRAIPVRIAFGDPIDPGVDATADTERVRCAMIRGLDRIRFGRRVPRG